MTEYRTWTRKEAEELERLWRAGLPSPQLAERFSRSRSSIIGKIKRLGLLGEKGSKQEPAMVAIELAERKSALDEKMRLLRIEERAILTKAKRFGIEVSL